MSPPEFTSRLFGRSAALQCSSKPCVTRAPAVVNMLPPPVMRPVLIAGSPPTPHELNGISKACARIGAYASFDHITCFPREANVLVSHSRSSSLEFGSPATMVEKLNTGAFVTLRKSTRLNSSHLG